MEQADVLRRVIDVLEELGVPYMVVGSLASGAYGEPRLTQDIDIVADLKEEHIAPLCEGFPPPEFYLSPDAAWQAVRRRSQFNIIHPSSGNKIDLLLPRRDAWGLSQLGRRQRVRVLADREGFMARPEDVIIAKMDYYRQGGSEKHLRDITGILKAGHAPVDRDYIARWAEELCLTEIWQAVVRRLEEREPTP